VLERGQFAALNGDRRRVGRGENICVEADSVARLRVLQAAAERAGRAIIQGGGHQAYLARPHREAPRRVIQRRALGHTVAVAVQAVAGQIFNLAGHGHRDLFAHRKGRVGHEDRLCTLGHVGERAGVRTTDAPDHGDIARGDGGGVEHLAELHADDRAWRRSFTRARRRPLDARGRIRQHARGPVQLVVEHLLGALAPVGGVEVGVRAAVDHLARIQAPGQQHGIAGERVVHQLRSAGPGPVLEGVVVERPLAEVLLRQPLQQEVFGNGELHPVAPPRLVRHSRGHPLPVVVRLHHAVLGVNHQAAARADECLDVIFPIHQRQQQVTGLRVVAREAGEKHIVLAQVDRREACAIHRVVGKPQVFQRLERGRHPHVVDKQVEQGREGGSVAITIGVGRSDGWAEKRTTLGVAPRAASVRHRPPFVGSAFFVIRREDLHPAQAARGAGGCARGEVVGPYAWRGQFLVAAIDQPDAQPVIGEAVVRRDRVPQRGAVSDPHAIFPVVRDAVLGADVVGAGAPIDLHAGAAVAQRLASDVQANEIVGHRVVVSAVLLEEHALAAVRGDDVTFGGRVAADDVVVRAVPERDPSGAVAQG